MSSFSESGKYDADFRRHEIEEFNLDCSGKGLRLGQWTLVVGALALLVSVAALVVALVR